MRLHASTTVSLSSATLEQAWRVTHNKGDTIVTTRSTRDVTQQVEIGIYCQ